MEDYFEELKSKIDNYDIIKSSYEELKEEHEQLKNDIKNVNNINEELTKENNKIKEQLDNVKPFNIILNRITELKNNNLKFDIKNSILITEKLFLLCINNLNKIEQSELNIDDEE